MKLTSMCAAFALMIGSSSMAFAQEAKPEAHLTDLEAKEAGQILGALANDYRSDPMAIDGYFGISVDGGWWTVSAKRVETPSKRGRLTDHKFGPHEVTITPGKPDRPTYVYEIADMNVLRLIASGKVNAGTAAMQSFESDEVGVEQVSMDGFKFNSGVEAEFYHHLSHFFTTGTPEITYFGSGNALSTHGAGLTSLHTMKGTRVGYFSMAPQDVANGDPQLSFGQMPNLFIVTKGKGRAFLGDHDMKIRAGMSIFVPPFVRHEIVNDGTEPLEGVIVLYGDNSDFAFGTSYPAFLQDLNTFYSNYEFRKTTMPAE